jgi:hypothetical protein
MKNFLFINETLNKKPINKSSFINAYNNNLCMGGYGFFILSLKCIGNVEIVMGLEEAIKKIEKNEKKYDMIFLDIKSLIFDPSDYFIKFCEHIKTQQMCLCINTDNIFSRTINFYKLKIPNLKYIYVVNLLRDFDKYNIPNNIKEKLRITFYGFGLLEIKYNFDLNKFIIIPNEPKKENDIFFSGSISTSPNRKAIIDFVEKEFNNFKKKIVIGKNLEQNEYINNVISSKINLAPSGNFNNITYRHNEILFLNSFLLTDYTFAEFKISENFSNLDSFCFKTLNDLKNLIYFYLHFEDEREKISKLLSTEFMNFYSPKKFSENLHQDLFH